MFFRPQSDGFGRALLGMSAHNFREIPSSRIRFSTTVVAVRIVADNPKSDPKNLNYLQIPNMPVFGRGTASDDFGSDYAQWESRNTPLENRIF